MDRETLEAMTPEERVQFIAAIEREFSITSPRTGKTTVRFSVGALLAEFMVWFMAKLPLVQDAQAELAAFGEKHGLSAAEVEASLTKLRQRYAKPYADAAVEHFVKHFPSAVIDAIEAQFLISISEAVDSLQGKTFASGDGVTLKFPATNRARLRRDIQELVRRQALRQFPGKVGGARHPKGVWDEDEEAAFVEFVNGLHPLAIALKDIETEHDLHSETRFTAADDRTKAYVVELVRMRSKAKSKADRRPLAVACRVAAAMLGKDAYSTAYLEKLYQRWTRERGA